MLPFIDERNYGIADESTLDVIRNLPSLIDSAEHESPAIQEVAEQFNFEEVAMSQLNVPSFGVACDFHEPLMTSTQINQERDPLEIEHFEVPPTEQDNSSIYESIANWMDANCGDSSELPVLVPPPAEPETGDGTPESDSIISGQQRSSKNSKNDTLKPVSSQKPWKKFEFTDTDDISPPLTSTPPEDKTDEVVEIDTESKTENDKAKSRTAKPPKKQYSAEIQKILDNAIARRKAARKANRLLQVPISRNEEKPGPKKKITWRDFAHFFPDSEDELTPSRKKRQSAALKDSNSNRAQMEIESNVNPVQAESKESSKEIVTVEAPKKKTWRDLEIADPD